MDPTRRDEKRVAGFQVDASTFLDQIAEKDVALLPRQSPLFVELQIAVRRRNEPKDLRSFGERSNVVGIH